MATLRATQLFEGTASSGSFVTKYTVPTGKRIILRDSAFSNTTGTSTLVLLAVNGNTIASTTLAGSASSELSHWIVLNAGETLDIATGGGRTVNVILSGYLLFV